MRPFIAGFGSVGEEREVEEMEKAMLNEQLLRFINAMFYEGYLGEQFKQLQMLQDANSPGFIDEVIGIFHEDTERILTEITNILGEVIVDYHKVDQLVHQLKGSSSSVGADQIKVACVDFRTYCEQQNKEMCLKSLNLVKHRFLNFKNKMETMIQLERRIQAYDNIQGIRKSSGNGSHCI